MNTKSKLVIPECPASGRYRESRHAISGPPIKAFGGDKVFFIFFILCLVPVRLWAEDAAPPQQLEGFNLNGYTPTGKKAWEVNGDKANITDEKINIDKVNANFYDPKQNANLTSRTGVINKTNGDIHLQDDVVITAQRGTKMTTDSLDWSRNNDLVSTKDPVKIVDEQGTVTGTGLTGHPNLRTAQLNQDVKAIMNLKPTKTLAKTAPAQTVQITCDGPMQMDQTKMYAIFHDHVVAVEASTGRELHADEMKVWFDDKNKKIKKVICTGHVSVIQGTNASYADQMTYNGDDGTLVMTGRPKLIFDAGESKGNGLFQKMGQ